EDTIGDIEIVAPSDDPHLVFDELAALPDVTRTLHRGARRLYVLADRVQIGVRTPQPGCAGAPLLYLTGSRAHIRGLQVIAAQRGWSLTAGGLRRESGEPPISRSEEDIYRALD